MISKIYANIMGTCSFHAKFKGMRKEQDFNVYPIKGEEVPTHISIQSDTRFGRIDLSTGEIVMSKPHPNGAYGHHLALEGHSLGHLPAEDLLRLKAHIVGTASGHAGRNGIVYTDNAGAVGALGVET